MPIYDVYKGKGGADWADPAVVFRALLVGRGYTPHPDHVDLSAPGLIDNELIYPQRPALTARSRVQNDTANSAEHWADHLLFSGVQGAWSEDGVFAHTNGPMSWVVVYTEADGKLALCFEIDPPDLAGSGRWSANATDELIRWDRNASARGVVFVFT